MKTKRKFIKPEAKVIEFLNDDIITSSSIGGINYPWWGGGDFPDTPVDR